MQHRAEALRLLDRDLRRRFEGWTTWRESTHSTLCRVARNCWLALSMGQGRALSGIVVLGIPPRTTPHKSRRHIRLSTVRRATTTPSRLSCHQILRAPETPKFYLTGNQREAVVQAQRSVAWGRVC